MHFDDILKEVGEFGKYQKIKYFLICLFGITAAFQALVSIFSIHTPQHRCALPDSVFNGTDTWESQSAYHQELVEKYIPKTKKGKYETCEIYTEPGVNKTECSRWVYDGSEVKKSIVTQWDLVCDKKLMATLSSSMFMFGNLAGSFISGMLSDFLGRRKTLLISIMGSLISGIVMAFSPEYYTFTIMRFFNGIFNMSLFLTAFVLGMEMIGPKHRLLVGIVIEMFWAFGFLVLIALGYAIRSWNYLQLTISIPTVFFVSYYWLMPESARWLLVKGRNMEAEKIILNVAKTNGRSVPTGLLTKLEEPKKPEKLSALRRAPRLLCRTIIIFFNWFVISMTYYGLSLNSGNLPGSLFVNTTVSAVAEVIGYFLCFLCFVAGRKKVHVIAMVVGGLGCISSIPVLYFFNGTDDQKNVIFLVLNNIGKVGVTIGFAVIYFWCAEIYPTLLRNSLMGYSSTFARVGSIFAPVIADIGKLVPEKYSSVLPPLLFGIFTISGGLLSIYLPETTDQELPETIAQANVFPKKLEVSCDDDDEDEVKYDQNGFQDDARL